MSDRSGHAPVLVVSPHYDDALLSAFALSTRPGAAVLTVFTGSPTPAVSTAWDARCGFVDSDAAMAARVGEDDDAFAGLDSARFALGLVESQYRSGPRDDADVEVLVAFVSEWIKQHGGMIALPVGAGRELTPVHWIRFHVPVRGVGMPGGAPPHPDHLWVTDTLLEQLAPTEVLLYEDLPYAWALRGDRRAEQIAHTVGLSARRSETPIDVDAKCRRVNAYASQVGGIVAGWVKDLTSVVPKVETTWRLDLL